MFYRYEFLNEASSGEHYAPVYNIAVARQRSIGQKAINTMAKSSCF